jgi:hypothetical protein
MGEDVFDDIMQVFEAPSASTNWVSIHPINQAG